MQWGSPSALALLVFVGGCGLFTSEPDLPSYAEVARAREADADEWFLLGETVQLWQERVPPEPGATWQERAAAALPEFRAIAAAEPGFVRLQALVQDLELAVEAGEAVRQRYADRFLESPDAMSAWLAARVTSEAGEVDALLETALDLDPALVQAEVLLIARQARLADKSELFRLVRLLRRHPGSAEGWRLLQSIASLYERPDLRRRAAETEPWSPLEAERGAVLRMAGAALDDARPEVAILHLARLPESDRDARLLRAAAFADAGFPLAGWDLLRELLRADPADAVVHFNLGLLAHDYLGRPREAEHHLREYLRLVREEDAPSDLQREMQAQLWLRRIEAGQAAGAALP